MISWMQKHNKYLVVTIWIATIAFIGAGFVGWGSYQYGSKAGKIAKVGDIEISKARFDMAYQDIYQRYNQMMQGKLDDKKAKEIGIQKQAFASLATEALLLNLANEFGIIVSEEEIAAELAKIPSFQTDGKFDLTVYEGFLKSRRIKAKLFDEVIHDDLVIKKLLSLLGNESLPFEREVVGSAINVSDKIAYKIIDDADLNLTIDENGLKKYWEEHRADYLTPKIYQLDILWKTSKDVNITDADLNEFYAKNSYNYIDGDGKQLTLENAKEQVIIDFKMKKTKKLALKEYVAFKKDQIDKSETKTVALNDTIFSSEIWEELKGKDVNTTMKPKAVKDRYATIKIVDIVEPKEMSFKEAKAKATVAYKEILKADRLTELAESALKNFDQSPYEVSNFLTLDSQERLKTLETDKSLQFLQKLFTSQKEKGIITVGDKMVVYKILEQKMLKMEDKSKSDLINNSANQIKMEDFQSNLLKILGQKYIIQKFVEGI
jgi:peptidyl-prolyl cis-trans isomerase D